jgi:hypothetical protein
MFMSISWLICIYRLYNGIFKLSIYFPYDSMSLFIVLFLNVLMVPVFIIE